MVQNLKRLLYNRQQICKSI